MNDIVLRLLVVAAVVAVAAAIAWVIRRVRTPPHPRVIVDEVGERPGVVLFTSTTCPTCKDAIAELESHGIAFREVTNDLEPGRFETWGVAAVPLTVVVDADGGVVRTFSGVPRRRPLMSALREAGVR